MVAERGHAERHDEMAEHTQKMGEQPSEPSVEERNLQSTADKSAVGSRSATWRIITSVKHKERTKDNEQQAAYAREYTLKVVAELQKISDGIFALTDENLCPWASTGEPKALQRQAPMIRKVLETVEFPQVQYVGEIVGEPVVMQGQVPTTQTGQKTGKRHRFNSLIQWRMYLSCRGDSEVIRIVDSEDLPMNISGETLLQNKILRVIKKSHVTKYLEMLAEIAEQKDDHKMFHEQFGERLKHGIHEDSTVGVKTAEVLRFNTSKPGGEHSSVEEYVDRMKEGQNDIVYITGENVAIVSSSPFVENLRKRGLEAHHIVDPADEHAVQRVKEFGGK